MKVLFEPSKVIYDRSYSFRPKVLKWTRAVLAGVPSPTISELALDMLKAPLTCMFDEPKSFIELPTMFTALPRVATAVPRKERVELLSVTGVEVTRLEPDAKVTVVFVSVLAVLLKVKVLPVFTSTLPPVMVAFRNI